MPKISIFLTNIQFPTLNIQIVSSFAFPHLLDIP